MTNLQENIWIRINGIGHAFSRELGCDCDRCREVIFKMTEPSGRLEEFPGWQDPPWRVHTSASILIPDEKDNVKNHILIDIGAGVVDSLVCSKLSGLEDIQGILISHWHPDHVLGLNQLCESLRRSVRRKGTKFIRPTVYCTLKTYKSLQDKGFSFEFDHRLCFHQILPEIPFKVYTTPPVTVTALEVAHGDVEGAVIYIAEIGSKKVVFGWDIDVPTATLPKSKITNESIIRSHQGNLLKDVDILLISANTWEADMTTGKETGHTSYNRVLDYIGLINPQNVYLVHLSGHEDGENNNGYGWTDSKWERNVSSSVKIAKQGMLINV